MTTQTFFRSLAAAALLAAVPVATVSAVTATPSTTLQAIGTDHLANLKTKGTAEIERRVTNLNTASAKLSASTKLSAADKAALTKQVTDEIAGLNALKMKLAGESQLAAARADVTSIVADYRVYVLMLPKVRMVASDDRFAVVEQKLTDLQTMLQTKVTAAKSSGKDITAMQKSLDDMKAKIADAQTQAGSLVTKLLALQPTDYNSNHAVLVQYRASLKTAQTDLKTARDDAKSVADSLQGTTPSASPAK